MIQVNLLRKHTPGWVIFLIDIIIVFMSIVLAYLLRFNFHIPKYELELLFFVIPSIVLIRAISFVLGKTYAGIVRHTSIEDAERIFIVISAGSGIFIFFNILSFYFIDSQFLIPSSVVVIEYIASIFLLTSTRLFVKIIYHEFTNPQKERVNVIIYGTDHLGIVTKRTLDQDEEMRNKVVAFIDNSKRNEKKKIEGVLIYNSDDIEMLLAKYKISKLIFAKKHISAKRKKEIIELCLQHNVNAYTVPPAEKWINGELSYNQFKTVNIEDLLDREPIRLDINRIKQNIINKNILVTGAAGSIGSEIVRQLSNFNPQNIILYDKAESPLYDLELELREKLKITNFIICIGDITCQERLESVFEKYEPTIVFHAAAYKHVPMMELNPHEAIRTNVNGTKMVADLANKYKAFKFIMISTDKAVRPTNVMGASKRIAEMYIQSLNKKSETKYITTRFGNVLGSNGSVILRFKNQIENREPVTVTHPDITRYFMTIPEACQLVLEASIMGEGGEIFIFDMGKLVKIVDLAKKMIKLYGLTIGKDIQLKYTGLRPGEKLYEELWNDSENNIPTHHNKIMIAQVAEYEYEQLSVKIQSLFETLHSADEFNVVRMMKNIVPEFLSKNSIFEELDHNNQKDLNE
ncbi:MAG TPA: polysaccharide biosynthesis protein [Bacteroidales bacterium]|nr:MAG: polysaccharide biosynthesis protein [Bacteroidetes bacterium GWF2_33_38]OFY86754.1 MAG: polysaccharide biosynthesis protein [Bacteroidetes bacterium RIFOXYA2_FULL_33_7]HBF88321.1 polysaccharide biosynthesis protein [Bacteroidales bacterium]